MACGYFLIGNQLHIFCNVASLKPKLWQIIQTKINREYKCIINRRQTVVTEKYSRMKVKM